LAAAEVKACTGPPKL